MAKMDWSPGYTVRDLVFYTGVFSGMIATFAFLQGVLGRGIMLLLVSMGVGWVFGMIADHLYERSQTQHDAWNRPENQNEPAPKKREPWEEDNWSKNGWGK